MRTAPSFRCALVGIEALSFWEDEDLIDVNEASVIENEGLVISQEIWEIYNKPVNYVEFKPGYYWLPFRKNN